MKNSGCLNVRQERKADFACLARKISNGFRSSAGPSNSGFRFQKIREVLLLQREDGEACCHVRDLLKAKIELIHNKITELTTLEQQLKKKLRKCERSLRASAQPHTGCCPVLEEIAHRDSL